MLRKIYDWVLHWAKTPYGLWALFFLAFCESSFFPIPPDVLLIALGVAIPKKSFKYAAICSAGSVLGGCFGYLIGWHFMTSVGVKIISFYGLTQKINYIQELYANHDIWAVGIAGFTPVPYKVITISAGFFKLDFLRFIIVSAISRSARFFIIGGLIYFAGATIQKFIDNYFNLLSHLFIILLVAGFVIIKYLF